MQLVTEIFVRYVSYTMCSPICYNMACFNRDVLLSSAASAYGAFDKKRRSSYVTVHGDTVTTPRSNGSIYHTTSYESMIYSAYRIPTVHNPHNLHHPNSRKRPLESRLTTVHCNPNVLQLCKGSVQMPCIMKKTSRTASEISDRSATANACLYCKSENWRICNIMMPPGNPLMEQNALSIFKVSFESLNGRIVRRRPTLSAPGE